MQMQDTYVGAYTRTRVCRVRSGANGSFRLPSSGCSFGVMSHHTYFFSLPKTFTCVPAAFHCQAET